MAVAVDHAREAAAGTVWSGLMSAMATLVKIGIVAGLTSTIVVQILAQPRIFMSMAKDGLLPTWAAKIHPRFGTPHVTTIITGLLVAVAAGFTPISVLGSLVSIGTLFAFVVVSIGVLVLRRTQPDLPRPFRTPWVPLVPVASAVVSLVLMLSLPIATWERLGIWMAIGVVFYFVYGRKKAALAAR
jgi:APA family basic amino acid/polyamine antiporter